MALDTFISGRYTNAYNGVSVGITDNGFELQQDSSWEQISTSDAYGDSILDGVYRGGSVYLQFESKAFKNGSISPFWPWGSLGVMQTPAAPVGRLASDVASAMVLTAVAGTPAAVAASPNTLTGSKAILAPNSSGRLLFTSRLRQVPIRLVFLPTEPSTGTTIWFSTT